MSILWSIRNRHAVPVPKNDCRARRDGEFRWRTDIAHAPQTGRSEDTHPCDAMATRERTCPAEARGRAPSRRWRNTLRASKIDPRKRCFPFACDLFRLWMRRRPPSSSCAHLFGFRLFSKGLGRAHTSAATEGSSGTWKFRIARMRSRIFSWRRTVATSSSTGRGSGPICSGPQLLLRFA